MELHLLMDLHPDPPERDEATGAVCVSAVSVCLSVCVASYVSAGHTYVGERTYWEHLLSLVMGHT